MGKASKLFFSTDNERETLYTRIVPTEDHTTFLQENWNRLAEFLRCELQEISGFPIRTWLQGSYKFATVIRPLSLHDEYDVDLGIYFCWASDEKATPAPQQVKQWVQACMMNFLKHEPGVKEVEQPMKERCSRIRYQKQFHIDVPAYHLDEEKDQRLLATATKGWEDSDPKALFLWFAEQAENPERAQLRRIVRYLKAWAILTFRDNPGARPCSILLTVLVTKAFLGLRNAESDDEDAFCAVVEAIYLRLKDNSVVLNPVNKEENLNRLDREALNAFLNSLASLVNICSRALQAEDEGAAALVWDEAFSYLFPLPQEDTSVEFDAGNGRAVMLAPVIHIDVRDASGNFLGTYRDEVPPLLKSCRLKFRIINPSVVPPWATIDWVVRNEGEDAASVSDIGHAKRGTRDFENEERTAYNGRHFMDCIVRANGQVISVKRIPVYIKEPTFQKKLPLKPYYRRFIKRRRR
jgi:Adenylyl/Guanylyl and SMODS C-terminal sensor domain